MTEGGRRIGVLIIDDDDDARVAVRALLQSSDDFDIVGETGEGAEGLFLARQLEPDLVLLDYMMPFLNGRQVADLLREQTPGSRIVAFSGHLDRAPDWADAYFVKDRVATLPEFLRDVMDRAAPGT
ncbi:MAG TPA: response regulator [Actinomycetota bacterium]|nr:response regulator [Actinomycetota bacterium]